MNKNLLLLTSIIFAFSLNSWNQTILTEEGTPSIHVSKPFETQGTTLYYVPKSYITTKENIVAVIPNGAAWHKSYSIEYFDFETGELLHLHEESMGDRDVFVETAQLINNRLFVFYSEYNKSSNSESLFAREILYSEPGKMGKEYTLVSTTGRVRTNSDFDYWKTATIAYTNSGKFTVYPSDNYQHFVVKYSMRPEKKIDGVAAENIGLAVFDSEMGKVWERTIRMPQPEANLDLKNIALGYDNSVNLLLKYKENQKDRVCKISVLKVTKEGAAETFQLNSKDLYFEDVQFKAHPSQGLYLAGYYRSTPKGYIIGTFSTILQTNGIFSEIHTDPFDLPTLLQFEKNSANRLEKINAAYENGEFGVFYLKAKKIDFLPDGSVLLTGHQYRSTSPFLETDPVTFNEPGGSGNVSRGSQAFQGIWLVKLNGTLDKVIWESRVPLNTEWPVTYDADNDFFVNKSYSMLIETDQAVFIVPENSKNTSIANDKPIEKEIAPYNSIRIYQVNLTSGDKKRYVFATENAVGGQKAKNFSPERVAIHGQTKVFVELTGDKKSSNMYMIELK